MRQLGGSASSPQARLVVFSNGELRAVRSPSACAKPAMEIGRELSQRCLTLHRRQSRPEHLQATASSRGGAVIEDWHTLSSGIRLQVCPQVTSGTEPAVTLGHDSSRTRDSASSLSAVPVHRRFSGRTDRTRAHPHRAWTTGWRGLISCSSTGLDTRYVAMPCVGWRISGNGSRSQSRPVRTQAWCWTETFSPFFAARGYSCSALSFRGQARIRPPIDGPGQLHYA